MEAAEQSREELIKKVIEVNDIVWASRGSGGPAEKPLHLVEEVYQIARDIDYPYGIARSTLSLGMAAFLVRQNYQESLRLIGEAAEQFRAQGDKKWMANSLLTLAIIGNSSGNPEAALYNGLRGMEYYEQNEGDPQDMVMAFYVIGTIYKDLKKFEEAEKYYIRATEIKTYNGAWMGRIYTSLSNIYSVRGQYSDALELAFKSLDLLKQEHNVIGVSRVLTDIGSIYRKLKRYDQALDFMQQGLKLREELGMKQFMLGSLLEIAAVHMETQQPEKAIEQLLQAEPLAKDTTHDARLNQIYRSLAELYKQTGELEQAIAYYEQYIEKATEQKNKELETKIAALQNSLLQEKEQEIERLKNVELKNAYHLISEKNKEITDSIHYAKRIQKTLLASDELLQQGLPSFFALYKPKDIVSGDFYWGSAVKQDGQHKVFWLAVCDCTGHGVPGAFMSLLNISFLNEAINEKNISLPGDVFNHVRERLIQSVSQEGGKDGMDGILLKIEYQDQRVVSVQYAAANNAPVCISSGKLAVLPGDKMPVGIGERKEHFNTHQVQIKKGDALYLFTDGYADQFGGPKGKKFKQKQLLDLLQRHSSLPLQTQKELMEQTIENWKGELEQVDDILLIAVKF